MIVQSTYDTCFIIGFYEPVVYLHTTNVSIYSVQQFLNKTYPPYKQIQCKTLSYSQRKNVKNTTHIEHANVVTCARKR